MSTDDTKTFSDVSNDQQTFNNTEYEYVYRPRKSSHHPIIAVTIVAILMLAAIYIAFIPNVVNSNIATLEVEISNSRDSIQTYDIYINDVWKEKLVVQPKSKGSTSFEISWDKDKPSYYCKVKAVRDVALKPSKTLEATLKPGETKKLSF